MQFAFRSGTGTTDAIFIARQLQERYRGKHRELWWAFVDLEKAFDRVPRKVVEWAMRKLGVEEELLVRAVMMMMIDVVLRHTLPVFTGLGRCPIVNWDFSGAVSIFWTGCPSCRPPMTFTRIRTCDLSSESCSS